MPIPEALVSDIRGLQRKPQDWFSLAEVTKRDPEPEVAARYIQTTSGRELVVRRNNQQLYEKLEDWAARLLEHEVRSYEQNIWELCSENSFVPAAEDDEILRGELSAYIDASVQYLKDELSRLARYTPDVYYENWSKLKRTADRLRAEMSVTIRLAGEISRLEVADSGDAPIDRIGYGHIKIDRFLSSNYSKIPHPFAENKALGLPPALLRRVVRLVAFVVFKKVDEPRLAGFEKKFLSVFLRYLSCSRESCSAIVEQVSSLWEPFLKKLSFLFAMRNAKGDPVWPFGLDGLVAGLRLSSKDLRETDKGYWQTQSVEDAVLRLAYQLRHKGAHEAHDSAYYEHERNAYFVFAAVVVSCKILIEAYVEIGKLVDRQEDVDEVRDLFVRIEELSIGPDGPRLSSSTGVPPSRLQKLLGFSSRAQAVWPNCSAELRRLLESEYLFLRNELSEVDREANIQEFIDAQQEDGY